ncbi:MAG: alpha/beta hydrolase-fold protein [Anaerolineaceae bacterium]|nr:alpha/beta hydrolase-fold protein [Anaerolineaceae bacterium]
MKKVILRIVLVLIAIPLLALVIVSVIFGIANRTNGRIMSSGELRKYLVYVPESYNPDEPVPLVITIHGFAQWPANQMRISQWNDLADEYGFIVVYPSGTGFPLRWRVHSEDPESGDPEKEVLFISDLIDKLEEQYNIDPNRIYANGLSNGGGMSLLLACNLSERIAAIGGVAGAYVTPLEKCNPSRAVPLIVFHGVADPIVPFHGGPSGSFDIPFPDIPIWAGDYALKNSCDLKPIILLDSGAITGVRYADCANGTTVEFFTIVDGGHTWPGGEALPEWITGKTSMEIDATGLMWEFFSQYQVDKP